MLVSKWKKPLPGYFKASLIIIGVICLYAIIVGLIMVRVNKKGHTKSKFILFNVAIVKKFNKFVKSMIGKHWKFAAPPLLGLAFYLIIANMSSLFGLNGPTSKLSITVALAIYSVGFVQIMGIISQRTKHFTSVFEPIFLLFPINIVGDFAPIVSLSLRLFGNIVSGGVLLGLIYGTLKWAAPLITPFLHLVFDVFFGLIQSAVFVFLTTMFASEKLADSDTNPFAKEEERLIKEEKRKQKLEKKKAKMLKKQERKKRKLKAKEV